MPVTITINLYWLLGVVALAYIVYTVLGIRHDQGFLSVEFRVWAQYGKTYPLSKHFRRFNWWRLAVFFPAIVLSYIVARARFRQTVTERSEAREHGES